MPVLSVGNITVGGTGKTPTVKWLANWLIAEGFHPIVLQRGYGTRAHDSDVDEEGALLRASVPGITVIQSTEVRSGRGDWSFAAKAGAVVILDDGFQRLQMERDLDIVLVDATRPFGNGWPLPAGPLREWLGSIARADVVVVTRSDADPRVASGLCDDIQRKNPGQIVQLQRHVPTRLLPGDRPVSELNGRSVWLLSAIGHPSEFHRTVVECGAKVIGVTILPDHAPIPSALISGIASRAGKRDVTLIVVTSKDLPKISSEAYGIPIVALDVDVEFVGDNQALVGILRTRLARTAGR